MKVIDLLNKISKGEEAPKEIKAFGYVFIYTGDQRPQRFYKIINQDNYLLRDFIYTLDTEVEVIEDNDDLELIPEDELYNLTGFGEKKNNKLNFNFRVLKDKINELAKDINDIRKQK